MTGTAESRVRQRFAGRLLSASTNVFHKTCG